MFASNAEYEALFAKGWPHLRTLVSPHPHEKDAAKWAAKALDAYDPDVYHVAWPREVAHRFVRAMGAARPKEAGDNIVFPSKADVAKRLQIAGPVAEKEARAIIEHVTHPRSCHKESAIRDLLFLLEAMVGAEPIVDSALSRYEAMKEKELDAGNPHDLVYVAYWLGFLVNRLPEKTGAKHRARMTKLATAKKQTSVRDRFQMVVGGVKGIKDSGWKPGLHIAHFANDPKFLIEHAAIGGDELDMQLAYQGREPMLDAFAKRLRRVPAWRLPWLVDELAVVASPTATAMLKELTVKKAVAERALAALAARSGKDAAKASPPSGAAAKTKSAKTKTTSKKKSSPADIEKRFETLSAWLAAELTKVRGNKKKESSLLEEATNRYADIRTDIGEDPQEAIVHFFAADGCGYAKQRTPALLRVKPTDAELKRWVEAISN